MDSVPHNTSAQPATLVDVLRRRAEEEPDRVAFTFLLDGTSPSHASTYASLDRDARAIAAWLQSQFQPGERVLLSFPAGPEFIAAFFGCLYAGMVAIPGPSPDPARPARAMPRLQAIAADAAPACQLTASPSPDLTAALALPELCTGEALDPVLAGNWKAPGIGPDDLAYLQYTSGSTATPKGVMIRHANLLGYFAGMQAAIGYSSESVVATWLPHSHDYGLVAGLLAPVWGGVPAVVLPPDAFVKHPITWLRAISRYRVTHSGAPPFAYDHCVRRIEPADLAELDLSSWQVATVGAEPIRPSTLERFAEKFAPCGFEWRTFCPGYGMAETTLGVTARRREDGAGPTTFTLSPTYPLTGCGRPYPGMDVYIVDPTSRLPCPPDRVGEIWVRGPSVAGGYWNRPAESRETFEAYTADTGEGPFLRSGDLGMLHGGQLYITGRLKDLLIIRGQNIYPHDLEGIAERAHDACRRGGCAAFSVDGGDVERLVLLQEVEREVPPALAAEVLAAIRGAIAEHFELPVHAVALLPRGALPRTTSGKIQRHLCRSAFLSTGLEPLATWTADEPAGPPAAVPRTALEAQLVQIWQELLRVARVSPDDDFFALGGDSLLALQLVLRVEERFGTTIPATFFRRPTVAALAGLLGDPVEQDHHTPRDPSISELARGLRWVSVHGNRMRRWLRRPAETTLRPVQRTVEARLLAVSYFEGLRRLRRWYGHSLARALLYPHAERRVRRFLRALDVPPGSDETMVQSHLVGMAIVRTFFRVSSQTSTLHDHTEHLGTRSPFWQPLCRAAGPAAPMAEFERYFAAAGLEELEAHVQQRRGLIVVSYHGVLSIPAVIVLNRLGVRSTLLVGERNLQREFQRLYPNQYADRFDPRLRAALAAQMHSARATLRQGGIVVIAADGLRGTSDAINLPLCGRMHRFHAGFAHLALQTGAALVTIQGALAPDGRLAVTFDAPFDRGSPSEPTDLRVERMVRQYAAFLDRVWRADPAGVWSGTMRWHLSMPPVDAGPVMCEQSDEAGAPKAGSTAWSPDDR